MFSLGYAEIIVLLVIGLIVFANRVPALARWLGRTVADLGKEARAASEELRTPGR